MSFQTRLIPDEGNKLIIAQSGNVSANIEHAKALRSSDQVGSQSGDLKHAAHFPAIVVENYLNRNGITFAEFVRDPVHAQRMMNDPDLRGFRVWEGRV